MEDNVVNTSTNKIMLFEISIGVNLSSARTLAAITNTARKTIRSFLTRLNFFDIYLLNFRMLYLSDYKKKIFY
ncbi:MAG: hypothetical protein CFE23_02750 [Flavobacterium sp. BFFFF1]|nr:MAG: hypothetical protein CFE23_02750 [Flavobacterium sp. BFFFF1]